MTAEIVADQLLHWPDPPGSSLPSQAELIANHIHPLADLDPWPTLWWNRNGTRRHILDLDGTTLIERLDRLHGLATIALGGTRARTHRDLPCPRCHTRTVGRWAGSDWFDCTTCGRRVLEDDLRRDDRILVKLWQTGKLKI